MRAPCAARASMAVSFSRLSFATSSAVGGTASMGWSSGLVMVRLLLGRREGDGPPRAQGSELRAQGGEAFALGCGGLTGAPAANALEDRVHLGEDHALLRRVRVTRHD